MASLPNRIKLPDFAGRPIALPEEAAYWQNLNSCSLANDLLLLGSLPEYPDLPFLQKALQNGARIYQLQCPAIAQAMVNSGLPHFASTNNKFFNLTPKEAIEIAPKCSIWFHSPELRIAPDFWGNLAAKIELAAEQRLPKPGASRAIWLPGNDAMLLHQELKQALKKAGFQTIYEGESAPGISGLQATWCGASPELAISVNFRGLDAQGRIFELCRALKLPLAIWLVDNPWNLLSGITLPWWKEANLFVTDPGFIPELKEYGASSLSYLPLAAADHMLTYQRADESLQKPVFVGRSAFPQQNGFFAGIKLNPELQSLAVEALTADKILPDFHWWQERLKTVLWPGKAARVPAFGADYFSALRRARWIGYGLKNGLEIIGDPGWRNFLPQAKISPPVDYYGPLPRIYANAEITLNVTSLLLPHSLSQRHFDVWAAGGFLFSDSTTGLDLFPEDLTRFSILNKPDDFSAKLEWLRANPRQKNDLCQEWRRLISADHTYLNRVNEILARI